MAKQNGIDRSKLLQHIIFAANGDIESSSVHMLAYMHQQQLIVYSDGLKLSAKGQEIYCALLAALDNFPL